MARDAGGLTVSCDEFGIGIIFLYRSSDAAITLVSNSMHFLVTVCRHYRLPLHLHEESMLKRLIPYQLGQQPSGYHIFFDEIEMLGVGQFLRVKDGRVLVENENRRQYVSYSDALDAAVTAMREQVRAIASFTSNPVIRLSGGYDSRVVFGAMVREDVLRRSWCWTLPRLDDDFRAAKLLVNFYGGEFAKDFPFHRNAEALSLGHSYDAWSSRNFGFYSKERGIETHRRLAFDRKTVAVLNGGGGECFRDHYFQVPDLERRGKLERAVRRFTKARRFPSIEKVAGGRIADAFTRDLKSMPGSTLQAKLRAHYLNFRNRFHFGFTTDGIQNRVNFSPLMQSPFIDAAEFMRQSGRDPIHIVRDTLAALDERLLSFPFDKTEKHFVKPEAVGSGDRSGGMESPVSIYDPVAVVFRNKRLFRDQDREQLVKSELVRATEEIADSGVFGSINFRNYVADIEERAPKSLSDYHIYRYSIISTANIIAYAS